MTEKNDGGAAYPTAQERHWGHDGLTLRDYFAGQAIAKLYTLNDRDDGEQSHEVARLAYLIADAMLAERSK